MQSQSVCRWGSGLVLGVHTGHETMTTVLNCGWNGLGAGGLGLGILTSSSPSDSTGSRIGMESWVSAKLDGDQTVSGGPQV